MISSLVKPASSAEAITIFSIILPYNATCSSDKLSIHFSSSGVANLPSIGVLLIFSSRAIEYLANSG